VIRYATAAAFKQAVETRLRSSSSSGIDFARRRQLLVFDRFLARKLEGGNSGIGKATVAGLAQLGATVVGACRDANKGKAAKGESAPAISSNGLHAPARGARGCVADGAKHEVG